MVERALRNVVREALAFAGSQGLPGDHHFYLTFLTGYPGVVIPDYLRQRYPDEMTIVIQYQFYGLEADEDRFSVTLSFNNIQERLTVPLGAVTTFADPSVNFALQFQAVTVPDLDAAKTASEAELAEPDQIDREKEAGGKVVTLDSFRKK